MNEAPKVRTLSAIKHYLAKSNLLAILMRHQNSSTNENGTWKHCLHILYIYISLIGERARHLQVTQLKIRDIYLFISMFGRTNVILYFDLLVFLC